MDGLAQLETQTHTQILPIRRERGPRTNKKEKKKKKERTNIAHTNTHGNYLLCTFNYGFNSAPFLSLLLGFRVLHFLACIDLATGIETGFG